ncbi:MAG: exodeoxyribonuclease VII large subunit, partial [Erysipelotrichia bacterium]|nr:exodeoxyribonuclease VII large subunit [Erysipelotrichia bacterium]
PINVQGKESAAQIINALIEADAKKLDVILLVRGGGSIEDLWSFNDERLARTIYALNTPLISGIGHEVDFTIADFVADLRAPTPTGAAERATPNRQEVSALLQTDRIRLINYVSGAIKESRDRLQKDSERSVFTNTQRLYSERQLKLDALFLQLKRSLNEQSQTLSQRLQDDRHTLLLQAQSEIDKEQIKIERCSNRLKTHIQLCISDSRNQLNHDISVLDAYSPLKVMKRGYSAVTLENKTINSAGDLKEGDRVHIRFSQGSADAAVIKVRKGE